jgi:hypothetical protein
MSAAASLLVAIVVAGCGSTTYFAGRTLPPSGLRNRVLITIQNPSSSSTGTAQFVDAYYDIRYVYSSNNTNPAFTISGFSGSEPTTIQNMPDELFGAIYSSLSGTLALVNYAKESTSGAVGGLSGLYSSVFITSNQLYTFGTSQTSNVLTVVDKSGSTTTSYNFAAPVKLYRVSVNSGGSVALVFAQNSNYVYYPRKLTAAETTAYSSGSTSWPKAAVDCEPQSGPAWCLFQAESPDHVDATGNAYGAPLTVDMPVKAVFSADGGTAYVLNCGPECGGTKAAVTSLSIAPFIFLTGQESGSLPTQSTLESNTLAIPGGASNALVNSSTLYVAGQCVASTTLSSAQLPQCSGAAPSSGSIFTGTLTVVTLPAGSTTTMTAASPVSISDGYPGAISRMVLADDNTLWIGMTKCTDGERAAAGLSVGCLTMVNIADPASPVATLMPYNSDATGIAAVTGLHKIYTAEGGQVYIYATGGSWTPGTAINNYYVTVTGTAYDVAYMDATSDSDNTDY